MYNQSSYNNSDERYDHDLSRFLQYTHTLKNSNEEGIRLRVYTSLKKELKDEHNTIRSSIEDFIEKEFPEYENSKYSLNAVNAPVKKKSTFSAVKTHVPFADLVITQQNTDNKTEIKQDLSSKNNNVKEKYNAWRDWWRWLLVPFASVGGAYIGFYIFMLIQYIHSANTDGYLSMITLIIIPVIGKAIFGFIFGLLSYTIAPRGKMLASVVMITLLAAISILEVLLSFYNLNFSVAIKIQVLIGDIVLIIGAIVGAKKADKDY